MIVLHYTAMATDIAYDLGAQNVIDAYSATVEYFQDGNIFFELFQPILC